MATRCLAQMRDGEQCGQLFDEEGYCARGHEDPRAVDDDLARLGVGDSCEDPACKVCGKPLEKHTAKERAKCHPCPACGKPLEKHTDRELAKCHPVILDPEGATAN